MPLFLQNINYDSQAIKASSTQSSSQLWKLFIKIVDFDGLELSKKKPPGGITDKEIYWKYDDRAALVAKLFFRGFQKKLWIVSTCLSIFSIHVFLTSFINVPKRKIRENNYFLLMSSNFIQATTNNLKIDYTSKHPL